MVDFRNWKTREVKVGEIGIGGNNPIRIQSMTTSPTTDIAATVEQITRLADVGCEIVRVTVQGKKEALACESIKNELIKKGMKIPLVADIHFYPPAALLVAQFVDKVRINPGNFADKRASFQEVVLADDQYECELERLEQKFLPLIKICKQRKIPLRIGVNHGSLSDRIMTRYGDTPIGMVQSAFEYVEIARRYGFHDIIFSMKSSNPLVMVAAYRLLVEKQMELGWDYPLHLGVTEAGEGEDGRVKSAAGIGQLLIDGIGDTIRVSLTEDPWKEIPECQRLTQIAKQYNTYKKSFYFSPQGKKLIVNKKNTFFKLHETASIGVRLNKDQLYDSQVNKELGIHPLSIGSPVDCVIIKGKDLKSIEDIHHLTDKMCVLIEDDVMGNCVSLQEHVNRLQLDERISTFSAGNKLNHHMPYAVKVSHENEELWLHLLEGNIDVILISLPKESRLYKARQLMDFLEKNQSKALAIFEQIAIDRWQDLIMLSSIEIGTLLAETNLHGAILSTPYSIAQEKNLLFSIMQSCRKRSTKTEFISCPGCGRTLFDLQQVSERIRQKTGHLPNVKIAIMGCIVNGPGEMADADFGYVGSKPGKIDLYIGKQCVEKNIDQAIADERLIDLIKQEGKWIDPSHLSKLQAQD